jgi:hypothetical protein
VAAPALPEAMAPDEAGAKGGRGNNKAFYNVSGFKNNEGNSASYTLARLKRDYPELAERVVAGELSANAAAIEAGEGAMQRAPRRPLRAP